MKTVLEPPLLDRLLASLPLGWQVQRIYLGHNWTLVVVQDETGRQRAGLASTPAASEVAGQASFGYGDNPAPADQAAQVASLVQSLNPVEAAVGLAVLNALLEPDPTLIQELVPAEWLALHGRQRQVALVGRFPFIEELRPAVARLWVLELTPQPGEYGPERAAEILPQADIVVITASTLINQSLEGLLKLVRAEATVMLLGPSTPLTSLLFEFGIDLLSGVQVVDLEAALSSVTQGVIFRQMQGVRRVTMVNPQLFD
jgi:uncharacterized protein (DUF4213/DUF364 family)